MMCGAFATSERIASLHLERPAENPVDCHSGALQVEKIPRFLKLSHASQGTNAGVQSSPFPKSNRKFWPERLSNSFSKGSNMLVQDAQRESRTVFVGGFWGQLVTSAIWLASAALGYWVSPRAAIISIVFGGFFIFPVTQLMLRLTGRPWSLSRDNPLGYLAMQIAFTLPMTMLLLVPVTEFRLNLFYPALMILVGAHYLPFVFLYGMRMFIPLCAILVGGGVVIALYFSGSFSLGGWFGGMTLFIFAWLLRASVRDEARGGA
jgi:hypothetical protein